MRRSHVSDGSTPVPCTVKRRLSLTDEGKRVGGTHLDFSCTGQKVCTQSRTNEWTYDETRFLIKYIALFYHSNGEDKPVWPALKQAHFWKKCAEYISQGTSKKMRSVGGCRSQCLYYLKTRFQTIEEAEEVYNIDYTDDSDTPTANNYNGSNYQNIANTFQNLTNIQQWNLLHDLYAIKLNQGQDKLCNFVPDNFLEVSVNAFKNLYNSNRRNTLYELAYSVGTLRADNSGTRMPLDRMPFPLIETNCNFFSVDYVDQVKYSEEYIKYLETMYAHFGGKWCALHCGPSFCHSAINAQDKDEDDLGVSPLVEIPEKHKDGDIVGTALEAALGENWENDMENELSDTSLSGPTLTSTPFKISNENQLAGVEETGSYIWSGMSQRDIEEINEGLSPTELQHLHGINPVQKTHSTSRLKTMDAKVNIVGISDRKLRKRISHAKYKTDTSMQVEMLQRAKQNNPEGRWWIKADACDIKKGVRESMRRDWSGDIDLGDGKLQEVHKRYLDKHKLVHTFMKGDRLCEENIKKDCITMISVLEKDNTFLLNQQKKSKLVYEKKKNQYSVSEDSLFALAWEVEGYGNLVCENNKLKQAVEYFQSGQVGESPMTLTVFRSRMKVYLKNIASKERDAASHLLIFMISDELRNMKPYALPVRVLPCGAIKDSEMRALKNKVKATMIALGMTVVGFVTDGEWNSLRTMGTERPVSIIQLIMEAKSAARQTSIFNIKMYLTMDEEEASPLLQHEAIPIQDVQWLHALITNEGKSYEEAVYALRKKMYPENYEPKPWTPGQTESLNDCLKSIFATYIFRWKVAQYSQNGVDFENHLYVPEMDADTQVYHMDREDHGHLLKRLTTCLRNGSIQNIDSQRWAEAMKDPDTGLTYTALTGKRKQSVGDCERMFSVGVIRFFQRRGYTDEQRFAEIILNWHKATDGRGIDDDTRKLYNEGMMKYILEDWMPYRNEWTGFSYLDINRPIKGIKGLTREVIVGLVANIESQELRRRVSKNQNMAPEHPRAGTSDDVESFIALLHHMLGPIFDHKKFKDNYRKICYEYAKRIDRNLPFYYHMGPAERYTEDPLPSFNERSKTGIERLDKIRYTRFSDPGIAVPNRSQLPRHGARTIRDQFHRLQEVFPPPPT